MPASPWTRRTAWPSATSTAGSNSSDICSGPPVEDKDSKKWCEKHRENKNPEPCDPDGRQTRPLGLASGSAPGPLLAHETLIRGGLT
ncbi:hypothetical protein GCM10017673_00820 [Streptosporangium violaceochromogenes]|nr:hypothetical protein GCM10017673_00820 [Streptosporangium violaceochromogenes]